MPLVGFYCLKDGRPQTFDYCLGVCGECQDDIPFLFAITSDIREVKENTFSVTEIAKPYLQQYLSRTYPYYVHPNDLTITSFGQAFHLLIANTGPALKDLGYDYAFEKEIGFQTQVETEEGTVTFKGTPDQYNRTNKKITDYKTLKYFYEIKYQLEGRANDKYKKQVNVYRVFALPEAQSMELFALVKDYNQEMMDANIPPYIHIPIDKMPDEEVRQYVKTRLTEYLRCQRLKEFPPCNPEERYYQPKTGRSLACLRYCSTRYICPIKEQFVGPEAASHSTSLPSSAEGPTLTTGKKQGKHVVAKRRRRAVVPR